MRMILAMVQCAVLLIAVPATLRAADMWLDANGDGLPDLDTLAVQVDEPVTVGIWIDSESFLWTNFLAYVDYGSGLVIDSATYAVSGGSAFPVDDFSRPNAIGLGGSGYSRTGVTKIGDLHARPSVSGIICTVPVTDESQNVFSQLGAGAEYSLFLVAQGTCIESSESELSGPESFGGPNALDMPSAFYPQLERFIARGSYGEPLSEAPVGPDSTNRIVVLVSAGAIRMPQGQRSAPPSAIVFGDSTESAFLVDAIDSLVALFPAFQQDDTLIVRTDTTSIRTADLSLWYTIHYAHQVAYIEELVRLSSYGGIVWAEPPLSDMSPMATSIDDEYEAQWNLWSPPGGPMNHINVESAWDRERGDAAIRIGIYDTGVDYRHPDLGGAYPGVKVTGGYNWVENNGDPMDDWDHGTGVAGVAAALTNNPATPSGTTGQFIAGIAGGDGYGRSTGPNDPGSQIIAMRTLAFCGLPSEGDPVIANAISQGALPIASGGYGINVMNFSWGLNGERAALRAAINMAYRIGVTMCAAQGNPGDGVDYPANTAPENWLLSVGGITRLGGPRHDAGPGIDVVAPAEDIPVLKQEPTLSVDLADGTSYATPQVAGLAALMLSINDWYRPEDIAGIIKGSARNLGSPGPDGVFGWGLVDAGLSVARVDGPGYVLLRSESIGGDSYTIDAEPSIYVFVNTGGGVSGAKWARKARVIRTDMFPHQLGQQGAVAAWGRTVDDPDAGWDGTSPNFETGWTNVTAFRNYYGSAVEVDMETFVFELWSANLDGSPEEPIGWWPAPPDDVVFGTGILYDFPDVTGIGEGVSTSGQPRLVFANPMSMDRRIGVFLDEGGGGLLRVVGVDGREVLSRKLPQHSRGVQEIMLPSGLGSGVYFVQVLTQGSTTSRKLVLLR